MQHPTQQINHCSPRQPPLLLFMTITTADAPVPALCQALLSLFPGPRARVPHHTGIHFMDEDLLIHKGPMVSSQQPAAV